MSSLVDLQARRQIESDLDRNLVVEAGAGSGKTESLARRMASGIAEGRYSIEGMAAVTFTRKAAAELRGRFQQALERGLTEAAHADRKQRFEMALAHLERFFSGTIHAFCAHLLRERPVEAEVAPGFVELDELQDLDHRQRAWREFLARERARGAGPLRALDDAGVEARDLDDAFARICVFEEVDFPGGDRAPPDAAAAWPGILRFSEAVSSRLPQPVPAASTCKVQQRARQLAQRIRAARRGSIADVATVLLPWEGKQVIVQRWWGAPNPRALRDELAALVEQFQSTTVAPFLTSWRRYVYRLAIDLLSRARDFTRDARFRALTLNYGDLLQGAARLLRERPDVRRALQRKYRWLFVDEFQDTDPIQAEVILLLASDPNAGPVGDLPPAALTSPDWEGVRLRPGALFIVGDPKQSIYRFRRADIEVYNQVRQLVERNGGETVELTTSFRARPELCDWVNRVFASTFPASPTPEQPAFHPLIPARDQPPAQPAIGVLTHPESASEREVGRMDAAAIASYVRTEVSAGRRAPGDFLVLTWKRSGLARYARELERRGLPVEVSGAGAFGESSQVRVMAALLRALSDPDDEIALVGVLRGPFFGLSDQQLFEYRQAGGSLRLSGAAPLEAPGPGSQVLPRVAVDAPMPATRRGRRTTTAVGQPPLPGLFEADDRAEESPERSRGDRQALPVDAESVFDQASQATPSASSAASQGVVLDALRSLRQLLRSTRTLPLASAVEQMLDATGYLAFTATETPGGTEAGDLLHAVDRIRQVAERGGTLAEAADDLVRDVEASEVESISLEPGRGDVVRVMNLHRAKGLEAPVVFLADPCGGWKKSADVRVDRARGHAAGFLRLIRRRKYGEDVLGEPDGWEAMAATELGFLQHEEERLRYVAATRARDLLIVSRWAKARGTRPWASFEPFLGSALELSVSDVAPAHAATTTGPPNDSDLMARRRHAIASREDQRARALRPSFAVQAVTAGTRRNIVVREDDPARLLRGPATGVEWGDLVHKLIEVALRAEQASRADLERAARWLVFGNEGLERVCEQAVDVVERVIRSDVGREALAAPERYLEVPIGTMTVDADGQPLLAHGVIDLVYGSANGGWTIVDHKTDQLDGEGGARLASRYADQVTAYARAWATMVPGRPIRTAVHAVREQRLYWVGELV